MSREYHPAELTQMAVYNFMLICKGLMFVALGVAALAYSGKARADVIATQVNQAGGVIILTDERASLCEPGELLALTTGAGGTNTVGGCWVLTSGLVMIRWLDDNTITTLASGSFTVTEAESKPADMRL